MQECSCDCTVYLWISVPLESAENETQEKDTAAALQLQRAEYFYHLKKNRCLNSSYCDCLTTCTVLVTSDQEETLT